MMNASAFSQNGLGIGQRLRTVSVVPSPIVTLSVEREIRSSSSLSTASSLRASSPSHLSMAVEGDFDPEAFARSSVTTSSKSLKGRLQALYKFTRPHTIRGTILASIAGTIRALIDTPGAIARANWSHMLPRALLGMVALLLGNAFIVGINQIYDKSIDEMNKPFLPVASGEMSKRFAWMTVVCSGLAGPFLVHALFPPLLFQLYAFGMLLGGIYSVPPIRTKRNPILAGLTIATVRGFLLNFGVYYAVKDAIGAAFVWSPKVAFIARFMTCFATVIAVTKDLPDVEGDKVSACCFMRRENETDKYVSLAHVLNFDLPHHSTSAGLSNRNLCYQSWSRQNSQGSFCLPVGQLPTCHSHWCFIKARIFPKNSHDWWSCRAGCHANRPIAATGFDIQSIDQTLLQTRLGFILFGICAVYPHLKKSFREP